MYTLYTIGHSNLAGEDFLARLQARQIVTLVDVRQQVATDVPTHYQKTVLAGWLAQHNIAYRDAGQYLGASDDLHATRHNLEFVQAIATLLNIIVASRGHVVLMSAHPDPLTSHRHTLIARALLDPAWRVIEGDVALQVLHITADDKTLPPVNFAG